MKHLISMRTERFEQLETPERKKICEKLFKALTDLGTDPTGDPASP